MNDQEPGLGWYVVGFLDALGQSQKLRQIASVPRTPEEIAAAAPLVRDTALYVMELRSFFRRTFESFTRSTGVLSDLPPEMQSDVEDSKRNIVFQGFSDSFVVSLSLRERFPAMALSGILVAASGAMCWSLSQRKPLRGGIDAGLGVNIAPSEIYGPVLDSAYRLECSFAEYPRILIGDELWKYLTLVAHDDANADIYRRINQQQALSAVGWIQTDPDGRRSLDYLTVLNNLDHDFWSQMVGDSYAFIVQQERAFQIAGDQKLAPRYARLRAYFEGRAELWRAAVITGSGAQSSP